MNMQKNTKQQNTQTIGQLIIRKVPNKKQIKPSHELRDLINSNCYINDLKYVQQLRQCFLNAVQGNFNSLSMKRNQNEEILHELSHIKFLSLRVLELTTNEILNIEAIGWFNAPNLRVLDLEQNLITNSKPLAKFYTKSLSELKIGTNLFSEVQCLARMKFRVNESYRDFSMSNIYGQRPYNKVHANVFFLAKLQQPQNLHEEWITINRKGQIKVPKFQSAIMRKDTKQRALVLSLKN